MAPVSSSATTQAYTQRQTDKDTQSLSHALKGNDPMAITHAKEKLAEDLRNGGKIKDPTINALMTQGSDQSSGRKLPQHLTAKA